MRTLMLAIFAVLIATSAWAGTGTCTFDDAAVKPLAAQMKVDPPKLCQALLDQRIKAAAMADQNRKMAQLRQACAKGDTAACTAIQTATKAVK